MPLLQKLTLNFCAFALLPLLLFGSIDYALSVDHLKKTAMSQLLSITEIQRQRLHKHIAEQQLRLNMIARHPKLQRAVHEAQQQGGAKLADVDTLLLNAFATLADIKEALIYDRQGILISSPLRRGNPSPAADRLHPQPTLGFDHLNQLEIRVDNPILYQGNPIGSFRLLIDASELLNIFTDYSGMGETGESLLVQTNAAGELTALHPLRHDSSEQHSRKLVNASFSKQRPEAYDVLDYRGTAVLAAGQLIPELNLGIIVKRDNQEILGPLTTMLARLNMFIIGVAVVGALMAARAAMAIYRPIAKLTQTAEKIRQGDLSQRANSDGHDEIATLGKAVNAMLDQLICDNARLEEAVALRTGEAQAARLHAEETSRLQGEFLANMSHEVRTPLNGILGIADLLKRSANSDQEQEYLQIIQNSGQSLLTIIDDILELSKANAGRLKLENKNFSLREELRELLQQARETAHHQGLEFHTEFDKQLPDTLCGDAPRLCQVLKQLLGNALKFTHSGSIHLRISWQQTQHAQDGQLTLQLQDSGIGIAKQKQAQIFAPFVQVDGGSTRRYGGTGLGLSITAQLVALMRGDIHVDSREQQGSTFTVKLPMKRASSAAHIYPGKAKHKANRRFKPLETTPTPHRTTNLSELLPPNRGNTVGRSRYANETAIALSLPDTVSTAPASLPEEADTMILDEQRLRDITRNKPALITNISQLFIDELPDMRASINSALQQGNREALAQTTHRMKSALGNFACADFYREFTELEMRATSSDVTLEQWSSEWQHIEGKVEQLLQELKDMADL